LTILVLTIPFQTVQSQEIDYWVSLEISDVMGLRGETKQITSYTNYTGYNLKIFNPSETVIYNQNHLANTTQDFTIPLDAEYGTYLIRASIPNGKSETWFTVLDVTGWQLASFPHKVTHQGINYTFDSDWTIQANDFSLNLAKLSKWVDSYGLEVTAIYNDMNFVVRFKKLPYFAMDMSFSFIHRGCKIAFNGTLDKPRDFTFKFPSSYVKRQKAVSLRNIVFDYNDIKGSYTYNNTDNTLTLHFPKSFDAKLFDPYIFESGFETSYAAEGWSLQVSDATVEIVSTQSNSGVNSSRHYFPASGDRGRIYQSHSGETEIWYRFYLNLTDQPNDYTQWILAEIKDGGLYGTTIMNLNLYYSSGGSYALRIWRFIPTSTQSDSAAISFTTGNYYRIEFAFNCHATEGYYKAWFDDAAEESPTLSETGLDTSGVSDSDILILGTYSSPEDNEYHFDDVVANTAYIGEAGGVAHEADLTQSLTSSWTVSTAWLSNLDVTQSLTSSWTASTVWLSTVEPTLALSSSWIVSVAWSAGTSISQALTTTYTVLSGFSLSAATSLGLTFTWAVSDVLSEGAAFATRGFVMASIIILAITCLPIIIVLILRSKR